MSENKNRSCGSCQYFLKIAANNFGGGICEYHDARTKADKRGCKHFKRVKFHRVVPTVAEHVT